MAIQTLNTIKNWFKTGLIPTQSQFWDTWDSFRHKSEKVPAADISGLDDLLADVVNIVRNPVYKPGEFVIFKRGTVTPNALEPEDFVMGIVEGQWINARYLGGDISSLESFDVVNRLEF